MKTINYSTYYWQNELVRLRSSTADDWEEEYYNCFDSPARFILQSELELPPVESSQRLSAEKYAGFQTNRLMFTIETLDGINVGGINLNSVDERNGTFSIGIQVGRDYRGQGYGSAAMKIVLDYSFNERRLHKYYGYVVEGNIASETMLKKLGCVQEGIRRDMIFHQGRYWNEIHYGLTADEFNKRIV